MNSGEMIITRLIRMSDEERVFWAQDNGFFRRYMLCTHCSSSMNLIASKTAGDKLCWQCRNYTCSKYQTLKSVRIGGCFEQFSTSLVTLLKIMNLWAHGIQQHEIIRLLSVSRSLLMKFENFLSQKLHLYFITNPVQLGGVNRICQIDESMLNFKVKSHVGRGPREKIWCFGIVDTTYSPSIGYVCIVPNRTAGTLIPIIQRVVRPGTTIISDEWPAYRNIEAITGLRSYTICHKENFVCPQTGNHTQNVESYWNKLKIIIKKMKGVVPSKHDDLLNVFMWRERVVGKEWDEIVDLVKL